MRRVGLKSLGMRLGGIEDNALTLVQALYRCLDSVDTPMVEKSKLDEDLQGTPIEGTINMGLWYSKDTGMSMTAYADADHAGVRTLDAVHPEVLSFLRVTNRKIQLLNRKARYEKHVFGNIKASGRGNRRVMVFEKCNMRLKTDIKPKEATFQVVLDALALTQFYHAFLITTDVPAIYMQEFWATVFVHRDIGHRQETSAYPLTDVNVDILASTMGEHCYYPSTRLKLSTKMLRRQTRCHIPDSQRSSLIPHVKGFIYFKENQDVWHTDRDDTLFTSMRCIFRHEDTQVYGTILPTKLTNQAMLESKAYQTYYAFAYGEKAPKPKYIRKKADFDTSPKKKPVQATKAEQIKLATKRSKKDFHVSHASGSGDGVDTPCQMFMIVNKQKTFGRKEGTDSEDKDNNDDDGDSDDHDDDSNDERIESDRDEIPDPKLTNVDQTEHEEEENHDDFSKRRIRRRKE
ncbi:hypothetical protein Tco_0052294 [Tanacetum coccineum]